LRIRSFEFLKILLFAAAYLVGYAGSRYLAQRTGTRLWFPDAILLCALLLVPRKKWWLYILVTAPVRFIPEVRAPVPAWFLWANWINDIAKSVVVAYLLQYAIGNSVLFKRVRQFATYLGVAVILAPVFSAFFGALVRLTLGHGFWSAFGQWYLGDALTNLVVTPTLLLWFSHEYRRLRPILFETAVWVVGVAISLGFAVWAAWSHESLIPLYAPFPFLIWAAARLGLIGASTGLSLTTLCLILGISQTKGPFYPIAHDMHFLQLFLVVLSLPVLFVASLFEERQAVEARLRQHQEELNRNYERTRSLAVGLIKAQEDERKKIGRELHDDVGQQIALLAMGLDGLEQSAGNGEVDRSLVLGLKSDVLNLAESVRTVAHQLHSSTLQYLGVVSALEGLCQTFSHQHQVEVRLQAEPLPSLSNDVKLCLFRVVQEALNNAVHHGHARQVLITLSQTEELLLLRVEDTGIGFDPVTSPRGLGLLSMEERLRLVGGTLRVQSSPGQGAVLEAAVSLRPEQSKPEVALSLGKAAVNRPRVLLGDDHVMFTDGLRSILSTHCEIVGTAEDGEKVIAAAQQLHPDVIILDISMPVLNGIKAARRLQTLGTSSKIVFCTMQTDPAFVTEAFRAGAQGYVLKNAATSEIVVALNEVLQGRTYISLGMRNMVADQPKQGAASAG